MITRIKGTQDFLDLSLYNWVIEKIKKHLTLYNFHEVATPYIEPLELFRRTLGAETDVISKEMYQVITDHTDQDSQKICLRPELTASIMRAFVNANIQQTPWKVFSIGPAFRHERPQKGRYRQFHQVSVEVIGSESILQDVLAIAMLDAFFGTVLQMQGYALLINYLGTPQDRIEYKKTLKKFLEKNISKLCPQCIQRMETNIMRVFDCKQESCQELYQQAPTIVDSLAQESALEWQQIKNLLEELSVSYSVKPTLVRGLDYYNKTVFEFVSVTGEGLGAQNAFCGGGRYDTLATQIGAEKDYPSFGAGIGVERLLLLLQAQKTLVPHDTQPALAVIIPLSEQQQPLALQVLQLLHAHNVCADVTLDKASIKSMLKAADRMQAKWAVLIGENEQQSGTVTIKNMTTGMEVKVAQKDILEHLV